MKNYIQICFSLLLLSFIIACNGQQKTALKKASPAVIKEGPVAKDRDPYFIETNTVNTPFGPNSITRNSIQDKKGDFWFATWEGIIKYDGKTFTNFTNKEGLKRYHVFSLLEDTAGNIWFGTIGAGVYRYDGKTFTNFTTQDGLAHNSIGCFMEDENGLLWIGTMDGISTYDGNSFTNYTIEDGLTNGDVNAIVADDTGKLWIGTRGATCLFDGKTFIKLSTPKGKTFVNTRTIIKDKKGKMWLGGNDGLWSYNGSTFTNFTDDFVGYIYQDKQENIWTSAANGGNSSQWTLSKYDYNSLKNKEVKPTRIKTEENMFFGITEDNQNRIWLGTLKGVYRYDGMLFTDFQKNEK